MHWRLTKQSLSVACKYSDLFDTKRAVGSKWSKKCKNPVVSALDTASGRGGYENNTRASGRDVGTEPNTDREQVVVSGRPQFDSAKRLSGHRRSVPYGYSGKRPTERAARSYPPSELPRSNPYRRKGHGLPPHGGIHAMDIVVTG